MALNSKIHHAGDTRSAARIALLRSCMPLGRFVLQTFEKEPASAIALEAGSLTLFDSRSHTNVRFYAAEASLLAS